MRTARSTSYHAARCVFRVFLQHAVFLGLARAIYIYMVYIRYFRQGNHQIYGHIWCIYIRFWPTLCVLSLNACSILLTELKRMQHTAQHTIHRDLDSTQRTADRALAHAAHCTAYYTLHTGT